METPRPGLSNRSGVPTNLDALTNPDAPANPDVLPANADGLANLDPHSLTKD
jgi:hypothetical protein